jgi:hypothetical protein
VATAAPSIRGPSGNVILFISYSFVPSEHRLGQYIHPSSDELLAHNIDDPRLYGVG